MIRKTKEWKPTKAELEVMKLIEYLGRKVVCGNFDREDIRLLAEELNALGNYDS